MNASVRSCKVHRVPRTFASFPCAGRFRRKIFACIASKDLAKTVKADGLSLWLRDHGPGLPSGQGPLPQPSKLVDPATFPIGLPARSPMMMTMTTTMMMMMTVTVIMIVVTDCDNHADHGDINGGCSLSSSQFTGGNVGHHGPFSPAFTQRAARDW